MELKEAAEVLKGRSCRQLLVGIFNAMPPGTVVLLGSLWRFFHVMNACNPAYQHYLIGPDRLDCAVDGLGKFILKPDIAPGDRRVAFPERRLRYFVARLEQDFGWTSHDFAAAAVLAKHLIEGHDAVFRINRASYYA